MSGTSEQLLVKCWGAPGILGSGVLVKGVLGTSENGDELPLALTEVALIAGKQHCYHYR